MEIHVHIHHDETVHQRLDRIDHTLHKAIQEIKTMTQELKTFIAAVDAATDRIAARIQALVDASQLSPADKATLQAEVDKLNLLGQDPNNPLPPTVTA